MTKTLSPRTSIRHKLREQFGIYIDKTNLYRAACAYNDSLGAIGDVRDMVNVLDSSKSELKDFAEYLTDFTYKYP